MNTEQVIINMRYTEDCIMSLMDEEFKHFDNSTCWIEKEDILKTLHFMRDNLHKLVTERKELELRC